jgi:prefoldin subunit 5
MTAPTVATLAAEVAELRAEVAELRAEVAALRARLADVTRLREILDDAGLPAPPPRLARHRRGLKAVK